MAKPIRATPTLVGDFAVKFVQKMHQRERTAVNRVDRMLLSIIVKNEKKFNV